MRKNDRDREDRKKGRERDKEEIIYGVQKVCSAPLQKSILLCLKLNLHHAFQVILLIFSFLSIIRDVTSQFI